MRLTCCNDYRADALVDKWFVGSLHLTYDQKEKDDQIKGSGNSYDFGARMYSSRLGKWWSMNAYSDLYPSISPYTAMENCPIYVIDTDGNVLRDLDGIKELTEKEVSNSL